MSTQLGMDPGRLTEEVELLENRSSTDTGGGRVKGWAPMADAYDWARLRPLSAFERQMANQAGAPAEYEVTMRWRDDLTANHRMKWLARDLELEIVTRPLNVDERSEWMRFTVVTARR